MIKKDGTKETEEAKETEETKGLRKFCKDVGLDYSNPTERHMARETYLIMLDIEKEDQRKEGMV